MSNIQLPIAELKPALAGLGKIIGRSSTLPVLRMVKIEKTKEGWIVLTASDLDSFISVRLEQPVEGVPMQMLVEHDHLHRITKKCQKNEALVLSMVGDKALVQYPIGNQMGEEHLESLPVADFPQVPKVNGEQVPIPKNVRQSLQEALQCASEDETRVVLIGAYLDVSDAKCHHIVSTDGRHLYGSNSFTLPLKKSVIIPDHKFLGWKEFNQDGEWQMRVSDEHLQISSRRWRFVTRQTEGNYPNWRQVVPKDKEFNTTVILSPAAIETILALIPRIPCHDSLNHPIGLLVIEGKKVVLRGRGVNDSKWTDCEVDGAAVKGKPVKIFLNRDFLTKALRFGMSTIHIIDSLSPMRFSHEGKQLIVMPVRGQEPPASEPAAAETPASPAKQMSSTGDTATERNNSMPTTISRASANGNGTTHTNGNNGHEQKPAIEQALDEIESIKGHHREAIRGLNTLTDTLKQVQRDQKSTVKEVQSVRTTLEKLQQVRI